MLQCRHMWNSSKRHHCIEMNQKLRKEKLHTPFISSSHFILTGPLPVCSTCFYLESLHSALTWWGPQTAPQWRLCVLSEWQTCPYKLQGTHQPFTLQSSLKYTHKQLNYITGFAVISFGGSFPWCSRQTRVDFLITSQIIEQECCPLKPRDSFLPSRWLAFFWITVRKMNLYNVWIWNYAEGDHLGFPPLGIEFPVLFALYVCSICSWIISRPPDIQLITWNC